MLRPSRSMGQWACLAIVFGCPVLLVATSYAQLAWQHRSWNLLSTVVHESGRYTLLETVFYFRHFTREIIPSVFVALGIAIAFQLLPASRGVAETSPGWAPRLGQRLGVMVVLYLAATQMISIFQEGVAEWLVDLSQGRTSDENAGFGTHWQYHFLHLLDALFFAFACLLVLRALNGWHGLRPRKPWFGPLAIWAGLFLLGCIVFGPVSKSWTEPLFMGHQLREIATHRLLSIPLGLGTVLLLEKRIEAVASAPINRRLFIRGIAWMAIGTLLPLWLYWQLRLVDIGTLVKGSASTLERFTSHTFEHFLDTGFICLLAAWLHSRFTLRLPRREVTDA